MTLGRMFINLLLMRIFAEIGKIPTEEYLFTDKAVTQDALEAYFNYLLSMFYCLSDTADYDTIRQIICATMDEMCDLSGQYNVNVGNSISYRDFIKLDCEDKDAYNLFHPEVKSGAFNEIEEQFKQHGKALIKYFTENKNTELHPFVASNTGVNAKQLTQCIGFIRLKARYGW